MEHLLKQVAMDRMLVKVAFVTFLQITCQGIIEPSATHHLSGDSTSSSA